MSLLNQTYGDLAAQLNATGHAEGVCRRLAVLWMNARMNGLDFMELLTDGSPAVSPKIAKQINLDFKALSSDQRSVANKLLKTELMNLGLLTLVERSAESLPELHHASVAEWWCDPAVLGEFRFLGIRGGYNHALAVDLRANKVSFYDPNIGEICFPTVQALTGFVTANILPRAKVKILPVADAGEIPHQLKKSLKHLAVYVNKDGNTIFTVDMFSCIPVPGAPSTGASSSKA